MLQNINELVEKFQNVEEVKSEIKRVQSVKCRLKKQKGRADYEEEMTKIVSYEQALKETKEYFEPKKVTVTTMSKEDIEKLNYEETMKAIKSIQSKKCNSQWLEDNSEYEDACKIEEMLLEHKKEVKPIEETVVKKSTIQNLVRHIENQDKKLDKEYVLELLNKVLNDELDF